MKERYSVRRFTFLLWYFKKTIGRGFKLYSNERELILALMIQIIFTKIGEIQSFLPNSFTKGMKTRYLL